MHPRVFAFDLDGTLAENGVIPLELQAALHQLRASGYALFLVTGRHFETITLGPLKDVFTGIVWENGAVLHHIATDEVYLPFGQIDPHLVQALEETGTPLERGRATASTSILHARTVWPEFSRR